MSLLPIYTFDHPVLRKETEQLTVDNAELQKLIDDMFETMYNANGIGLAANQVGRSLALTVIDISEFDEFKHVKPLVLINPKITDFYGESIHEEGCLSVPGIREEIVRPSEIGLKFYDRSFKEVEMETDKILARVMQHEIDHLHGKYFFDYLNAFKLSFLKNKLNKMKKGEVEADYPLAPPSSAKQKKGKLTRM